MKKMTKIISVLVLLSSNAFALESEYIQTQSRTQTANELYERIGDNSEFYLHDSDPKMSELLKKYIYADIASQSTLSLEDQELIKVVTQITLQIPQAYVKNYFYEALNAGIKPIELREALYQLLPYIGISRVIVYLDSLNEVFLEKKITLPSEDLATTDDNSRFEKGLEFQLNTYGNRIEKMRNATPELQKHLQDDLSAFCFGDIYTRNGLDLKKREFLTVAAIGALGIEPQFKSHVRGVLSAGGSEADVMGIITVMSPYVGFPRTLNLMNYVNDVFASSKKASN